MMRSLARQDLAHMGGRGSVLARQKRDHMRLDRLLEEVTSAPPHEQGQILISIYRLVFPHAFAEEAVLWPVIRKVLPDGEALTLRVEREHQEINELVTCLEQLEPGSSEHRLLLGQVIELLRADVRDEEDLLLPRLQELLTVAQLKRLGAAWEFVRGIAPTRAHPIVARRPPGNVLSALPLTIVDRLRDRLDARRFRRAGVPSPFLARASSGLASAARTIEQMPGMRTGEDPSTRRDVLRTNRGGVIVATAAAACLLAVAIRSRRARRST